MSSSAARRHLVLFIGQTYLVPPFPPCSVLTGFKAFGKSVYSAASVRSGSGQDVSPPSLPPGAPRRCCAVALSSAARNGPANNALFVLDERR